MPPHARAGGVVRSARLARWLTSVAALGFGGTAALHATGYDWVTRESVRVAGFLGRVLPALWLAFSVDMVLLGLILAVVALRPSRTARPIILIAALCPLSAAALQLCFVGFIPPTGVLLGVGVLTLVSAAAWPAAGPTSA